MCPQMLVMDAMHSMGAVPIVVTQISAHMFIGISKIYEICIFATKYHPTDNQANPIKKVESFIINP